MGQQSDICLSVSVLGVSLVLPLSICLWALHNSHVLLFHSGWGGEKRNRIQKKEKKKVVSLLLTLNLFSKFWLSSQRPGEQGGQAQLFSLPVVLRGWEPGLGHNIHSFPASDQPLSLWAHTAEITLRASRVPYKAAAHHFELAQGFSHGPTFQPVQRQSESGSDRAQLLPSPDIAWHLNSSGASVHSPSGCTTSLCLPLHLYSPSDCQHRGPSWYWAALSALVGEGAGDLSLLPVSCGRRLARGHGSPGPHADPRDLTFPAQSLHCLFFNVLCNFFATKLHISWDSVGCSLCSSEDWLGVPAVHRENSAPLLPTSLPSSCILKYY